MADWLNMRLGVSLGTARRLLAMSHALEHLPALGAAFEAGDLSWDKLSACVEIADEETDGKIASEAKALSVAHLQASARRKRVFAEAPSDHYKRSLNLDAETPSGAMRVSGWLPSEEGALVNKALERIIDQQPRRPDGLVDTIDLRGADALIELARTRLAQDTDTDRATVVVHADVCLLEGADGVGDIEGSGLLGSEAVRRLACDARFSS